MAKRVDMETGEVMSGDVIDSTELTVVESLTRAELDVQITTAKRYPRVLSVFRAKARDMACVDQETAASMFYALPRGGKSIEGPSVRLAEIVASCWQNIKSAARVISVGDKMITAQGVCHDLENNVSASVEVSRRITDKYGKRYGDDMIGVTMNAACSIALRNAIFKVVPAAFIKQIYDETRQVAGGDAASLGRTVDAMLTYYAGMGVKPEQIWAALGVAGREDVTTQHIITLKGLATAIKDGDTTVEQTFPPAVDPLKETKGRQPMNMKPEAKPENEPPTKPAETADTDAPAAPEATEAEKPATDTPEPEKPAESPTEPPSGGMTRPEKLYAKFAEIAESQNVPTDATAAAWKKFVKHVTTMPVSRCATDDWDDVEMRLATDFSVSEYVK